MFKVIKLILVLAVLSITVEASVKYCMKNIPKLDKCFEKGYRPAIFTDCKSYDRKMTGKKAKKCAGIEKKVSKKCEGFQCRSNPACMELFETENPLDILIIVSLLN